MYSESYKIVQRWSGKPIMERNGKPSIVAKTGNIMLWGSEEKAQAFLDQNAPNPNEFRIMKVKNPYDM